MRIVSGGQTGVDRAALDIAIALGIEHGGWCPLGRKAEDGVIDSRYQLIETRSADYRTRTRKNVEAADGTLIINRGSLLGGSALTRQFAAACHKPCLIVDPTAPEAVELCRQWIQENHIQTLNIAGPRVSKDSAIYELGYQFLLRLFTHEV